jgi:putative membrane protein
MSAVQRVKIGVCVAGLSCLWMVGYAQAQQQSAQHADQDAGRPLADQRQPAGQPALNGQRSTTYFRGPGAAGSSDQNASQNVDQFLASCLSIKCQAEIEMNKFAAQKSENAQVKQFAQKMIDDHSELAQRLAQLTAGPQGQNANNDPSLNQVLQLDRQIANQCISMARDKLSDKNGADFDQCFIGAQIGTHMEMLSALTVIANQTGGQLQQVARDARSTVQQHLQQAEELAEQLKSNRS